MEAFTHQLELMTTLQQGNGERARSGNSRHNDQ